MKPWQTFILWWVAALLLGASYLSLAAWGEGQLGFPLDDAWIHQTYARNLAHHGQLAFVPGQTSAGSTAPLWSLCLSLGYLLNMPPLLWAYALGLTCLALTAWLTVTLTTLLFELPAPFPSLVGLFVLFEWHHIWGAVSGMETMLFVCLSLSIMTAYRARKSAWLVGILGGLLCLTRPEGIGLVGLIGLDIAYHHWRNGDSIGQLLRRWGQIGAALLLLIVPYIAFHFSLTGNPFPSTFYAKQAEYAIVLTDFPLWWRLFGHPFQSTETVRGVFLVVFIGGQFLLWPGLCYGGWLTWRERRSELAIIWLWWLSFLLLYGMRLPVTYQHGRYQIPAIIWIIILGMWGTARLFAWFSLPRQRGSIRRILSGVMALSLALAIGLFLLLGGIAYRQDVAFITHEMVQVAHWLDEHVPPDALIAAHDIGAIGYIAQRPLLDLAGLITPEVIPFMRDETALAEFIRHQQVAYLVTFPSWYPHLTSELTPIYCTEPEFCTEHMAVYALDETLNH